jgi:hypothetical protein
MRGEMMTTTEVETTKRRTPATRTDQSGTLSSEFLDAGTALVERSARLVRTTAEAGLRVTDVAVLGTLAVAEDWASSAPVAGVVVPPVKVARDTWSATRDGLRDLVAAV